MVDDYNPQKTIFFSFDNPREVDEDEHFPQMNSISEYNAENLKEIHAKGNDILSEMFDVQVVF